MVEGGNRLVGEADTASDSPRLSGAMFAQAPFGLALIGLDMRYVAVNDVLAALHGRAGEDHAGRTFDEVIPRAAEAARGVFAQVLRERVAVRPGVLGGARPSGEGPMWEDVWYPIFDEQGDITAVAVAVVDISHLRRARDRLSALERLDEALDRADTTADVVASLEQISDEPGGVAVHMWLAGGTRSTLGVWNGPQPAGALPRSLPAVFDEAIQEARLPVVDVLASGRARFFETTGELNGEFPVMAPFMAASDVRSVAYLPLRREDSVFGVLRWTWRQERRFSSEDRLFFETVALRFGIAHQRARLRAHDQGAPLRADAMLEALAPLATTATPADVAQVVTSLGPEPLGANGLSIALVDPSDPGRRVILGSTGYPAEFMERIRVTSIDFPTPPNRVMVTSDPLYIRSPEELSLEFPEVADSLAASAMSWAALPLRSGGRTIGALTLSFAEPQRFAAGQRAELNAYASPVADALARALRQEEDHQLAVGLQRSLLPAGLPRRPGVALTARYLPGSDLEIGGDWYDAVALDDGRLFLVVGDVMGHGVEAAVAMGQLRAAAKALSQSHGPAQLLSELDRFVDDVEHGSLATVAAVVLDPVSGAVEYSLAGHPPPLVRCPDSTVLRLDGALGPPLGLARDPRHTATTQVAPGSLMVLYTDGLVERRGEDLGQGLARLEAAVRTVDPGDVEAAADSLIVDCLVGFRQRDDIALVCMALAPPPRPAVAITLTGPGRAPPQ